MPIVATNLIMGPAELYWAPFGSTEPAKTTAALTGAPAAPWVSMGGTMDGLTWTMNRDYKELVVDQVAYRLGTRLTAASDQFETKLAEPTLDMLKLVLNGGTVTVGATTELGVNNYEPDISNSASQMTYIAFLWDGWAPNGKRRRVITRKVCNGDNGEFAASKEDQSTFAVSFMSHYVSSSIKPFIVMDDVTA